MALVNDAGYLFSVTLQDLDGNKRRFSIRLPGTVLLADVAAAAGGAFATLLAGISNAVVVGWSLSSGGEETAEVAPPEASDVERKGSFVFKAANGQTVKVEVPSIKNELVVDKTNLINEADAGVAAFVDYVLNGIVGLAAPITNTGADITRLESATKIHRASSRG